MISVSRCSLFDNRVGPETVLSQAATVLSQAETVLKPDARRHSYVSGLSKGCSKIPMGVGLRAWGRHPLTWSLYGPETVLSQAETVLSQAETVEIF